MKSTILTLVSLFFLVLGSNAQSTVSAQNADAVKNYDGVSGRFGYALNERETMNVNYSITPKNPTTVAHMMLHTPEAMPLSAKIMDASGKQVLSWMPEQKVYLYNVDLNVSKLSAGTYTVQLYMGADTKMIHSFNFTKQ